MDKMLFNAYIESLSINDSLEISGGRYSASEIVGLGIGSGLLAGYGLMLVAYVNFFSK